MTDTDYDAIWIANCRRLIADIQQAKAEGNEINNQPPTRKACLNDQQKESAQ